MSGKAREREGGGGRERERERERREKERERERERERQREKEKSDGTIERDGERVMEIAGSIVHPLGNADRARQQHPAATVLGSDFTLGLRLNHEHDKQGHGLR